MSIKSFSEFNEKKILHKKSLHEAQMGVSDTDANQVIYGNQPLELQEISQKPDDKIKNWFIEEGLAERIKQEAPANDSEKTQEDLKILLEKTKNVSAEDVSFARYIDNVENIANYFIDILKQYGHDVSMGDYFRIDSQTESLLYFLKDVINRPRPYQLAKTFNYPLYPLIRTNAMTAAYPSGHALTGFVMSEYFSRKYPEAASELRILGEKIAHSREVTGIHYPSDTEISREICKVIFENDLIEG